MHRAYFEPDGDRFVATEYTRGPWDVRSQHGGPPSALLATVLEHRHPRPDLQLARMTVELLRPVPVAPLTITSEVARDGRRTDYLLATVRAGDAEVMRASAWRIAPSDVEPTAQDRPAHAPEDVAASPMAPGVLDDLEGESYFTSADWHWIAGAFSEPGPAIVWMRLRVAIVAGMPLTPAARVLALADSGNGISSVLDFRTALFINPDLTVVLMRPLDGEWVCLDARTTVAPGGIGLADSVLWDRSGPVGRGLQTLLVQRAR